MHEPLDVETWSFNEKSGHISPHAPQHSGSGAARGGRLISGFARGIPREHMVYNVSLAESRARFEEAWEIIKRAWTEEVFSYQGRFWSYKDVSIWPRPVQQPHPPVWVPVTASKETLEWAARENVPITPGANATMPVRQDMVRYYAQC